MSLVKCCIYFVLACCARLGETGRRNVRSHSMQERNAALSSMLLANPVHAGRPLSKTGSVRSSTVPEGLFGVNHHYAVSGKSKMKALYDNAEILSNLGLHDQAQPLHNLCSNLMDHGHNNLEAYRRKLRTQLRRADDQDVNLMKDVYQFKQQKLGKNHPKTLKSHHNYADVLGQVGRHAEAEPLKKELLMLKRQELGPEHVETVQAMGSYAETLMELSRVGEVAALQKEALEIAARTLGSDHPETVKIVGDYAATLTKLPSEEAEPSWKEFAQLVDRYSLNTFCRHLQASPCVQAVPKVVVKQCKKQLVLA